MTLLSRLAQLEGVLRRASTSPEESPAPDVEACRHCGKAIGNVHENDGYGRPRYVDASGLTFCPDGHNRHRPPVVTP